MIMHVANASFASATLLIMYCDLVSSGGDGGLILQAPRILVPESSVASGVTLQNISSEYRVCGDGQVVSESCVSAPVPDQQVVGPASHGPHVLGVDAQVRGAVRLHTRATRDQEVTRWGAGLFPVGRLGGIADQCAAVAVSYDGGVVGAAGCVVVCSSVGFKELLQPWRSLFRVLVARGLRDVIRSVVIETSIKEGSFPCFRSSCSLISTENSPPLEFATICGAFGGLPSNLCLVIFHPFLGSPFLSRSMACLCRRLERRTDSMGGEPCTCLLNIPVDEIQDFAGSLPGAFLDLVGGPHFQTFLAHF